MTKYEIHPAAELFPMMSDIEFNGLKADIKQHGQRDDIMIWKGQLVDGRNRLRACDELGIEPSLCEMSEELDPVDWVLSHNLYRRHLTTAQRAMVATNLATLLAGRPDKTISGIPLVNSSQADAAAQLHVSVDSVKTARKVRAKATPEVIAAVEAGTMSLNAAVKTTKPAVATNRPVSEPEQSQASIMLDSLGRQIPINLRSASELVIQLVATGRELDKFRKAAKDFAEQPGGDWLRVQDISDGIKVLKDHFQQAAYHTACVKCGGKGCKVCEMTGWIPDYLKGTL